jgi:hypothetical protein
MSSTVLRSGQVIAGRYRIETLLAEGGMGSVYRASQLPMERSVAFKVLFDEHQDSTPHLQRFEREAHALARLTHPNTVRLFDFGTTEQGHPYLVMELLEGSDLAARLARSGPLPWEQALHVAHQVLCSLEEAHGRGIVHRDIKPANVFLCQVQGQSLFVKVLDFGIAGMLEPAAGDRRLTVTGTVIGSVAYMSPEQAEDGAVGPAADLYAVGVVLFEMLTGQVPFERRSVTAQLLAKVSRAPRLREISPELALPDALEELVAELLERDLTKRPGSARAVADRVRALLEPLGTRPGSVSQAHRILSRGGPASPALPAKTEPMLAPTVVGPAWDAGSAAALRTATVRRRRLGLAILAAAVATGAALVAFWALRKPRVDSPPSVAEAFDDGATALVAGGDRPLPSTEPFASLGTEDAAAPLRLDASASAVANQAEQPGGAGPVPPASRSARSTRRSVASPRAPALDPVESASARSRVAPPVPSPPGQPQLPASPSAQQPSSPPGEPSSPLARYPNVAAVKAARDAGELGPQQSNELIRRLRQRRFEARARAGDDYKAGRISLEELKARQQAIEEAFEGG